MATANALHSGWATKSGGKIRSWRKRYFVLRDDGTLAYYEKVTSGSPQGVLDLRRTTCLKSPSECASWGADYQLPNFPKVLDEARIEIVTTDRKFPMFFETAEEASVWYDKVKKVVDELDVAKASGTIDKKSPVIFQGWGTKSNKTMRAWKKRYFVLRSNGLLSYYTKATSPQPQGAIDLRLCDELRVGEDCEWGSEYKMPTTVAKDCRFEVILPGRKFPVFVDTPEEAAEWGKNLALVREWFHDAEEAIIEETADKDDCESVDADDSITEECMEEPVAEEPISEDTKTGDTKAEEPVEAASKEAKVEEGKVDEEAKPEEAKAEAETETAEKTDSDTKINNAVSAADAAVSEATEAVAALNTVEKSPSVKSENRKSTTSLAQLAPGAVAHSGWLFKAGGKDRVKGWKKRYFTLYGSGLLTYAGSEGANVPLGEIDLKSASGLKGPSEVDWGFEHKVPVTAPDTTRFEIQVPNRTFFLYSETEDDTEIWIEKIAIVREWIGAKELEQPIPSTETLQRGWATKCGAWVKNWKRRYFVLRTDGTLTYGKNEKCMPSGLIDMRKVTKLNGPGECQWDDDPPKSADADRRFEIVTGTRVFRVFCDNPEETKVWLEKLSGACLFAGLNFGNTVEVFGEEEEEEEGGDVAMSPTSDKRFSVLATNDIDDQTLNAHLHQFGMPRTRTHKLIIAEALALAGTIPDSEKATRKVQIMYNPVSGQGKAKKVVETLVVPVLTLCGINHTVIPTEYAGHCKEMVRDLNVDEIDSIVICGGDGLVSEGITGLFSRTDDAVKRIRVGIVAVGTANAMAHELDNGRSHNSTGLWGHAAIAVAGGITRPIDAIEVQGPEVKSYGLSCIGWGLAGAVAQRAAKLRWVPGQKKARYDIAGFVTMMVDWPVICKCKFEFAVEGPDGETKWQGKDLGCVNLIASNVPKLGVDHPISPEIRFDDGKMVVAMLLDDNNLKQTVQAALTMKQGKYLAEHNAVHAVITSEFKITPEPDHKGSNIPYNLDGDPIAAEAIHVKCLNKMVNCFYIPKQVI